MRLPLRRLFLVPTPDFDVPERAYPQTVSKTVAVIGAGMTGLAAAHHLHSHGCRPVVLEAGQGVGGQVRSRRLGSDVVDMGPEAVPLRAPGVAALVAELGLTDSMRHPVPGRVLLSSRRESSRCRPA